MSLSSPVNIPMGGYYEVYTSLKDRNWRNFNYANVRKASYTGCQTLLNIPIILTTNMMCSVFKFWTIGGIFLYMFSDALLFNMMLNTAYEDCVDTVQDLIDRDMYLGIK